MKLELQRDRDEPWHRVVTEAAPCDHIVQLYQDQDFLNRAVCRFAGAALSNGEGIILVPTLTHWNAIRPRLEAEGVHVEAAQSRGQLTVVDADELLPRFMRDAMPDAPVFLGLAADVVAKARGGGQYSKVRWWGEMVNVLWERGDVAASMNLEDLFDQLAHKEDIAIFCSFLMDNFNETTWQGADLRKLIEDQLSQWAADEIKFTACGPAVLLTPQVTVHLALVLHELGTNSAKYGALSAAAGRVKLSWTVSPGMLHLQWVERGGPAVSVPTRRGFGTLLIAQSTKGEGGDAQMICETEGVSWKIMLPLASSAASKDPSSPPTSERIGGALRRQDAQQRADSGLPLAGRHFLVIEDEPLIALDLAGSLEAAGAKVVPPVGKETEALQVIERTDFDAALLDGNLHGRPVDAIAAALTRRNIPFVFVTGYGREGLPSAFKHIAVLTKPFGREQLLEAVNEAVQKNTQGLPPQP